MPNKNKLITGLLLSLSLAAPAASSPAAPLAPCTSLPVRETNPVTPAKVELGKKLFFDRRLSGDGTMSCATCHIPEMWFTDGQAISQNYPTTSNWRNAPALVNLAAYKYFFHDGRVESLEEQALFPILSAFEMNRNLDYLEEEIRAVPEYVAAFTEVFGSPDTSRERIALAIAAFERTIVSDKTPLDRYLSGDKGALSAEAVRGMEVFTGKGRCADCHGGANLTDNKFHALHVPEHPNFQSDPKVAATRRFVAKLYHYEKFRELETDPGRYLITKKDEDWRAFRTPNLREVKHTGPYMHNGIFGTLSQVIDFFDKGGGEGNKALKPLGLTGEEKKALEVFLAEALTQGTFSISYPKVP